MNAQKTVFTPEQASAVSYVRTTADNFEGGAIANCFALCIAEIVAPGMISTSGRNMADHRRDAMAYMADRMSPASLKRQFQRAEWLDKSHGGAIRTAYDTAPKGDDGVPFYGRVMVAIGEALKPHGIVSQHSLDVAAGLVKPAPAKLSKVEKAKASLARAEKAEATEAAEAEAKSPAAIARAIVATIATTDFDKADRDAIFAALLACEARQSAPQEQAPQSDSKRLAA